MRANGRCWDILVWIWVWVWVKGWGWVNKHKWWFMNESTRQQTSYMASLNQQKHLDKHTFLMIVSDYNNGICPDEWS